jgi:CRISPR-associated protein Cmr2
MKYIALTIGPIYKTISKAKKPKELFAGSYVFSYGKY